MNKPAVISVTIKTKVYLLTLLVFSTFGALAQYNVVLGTDNIPITKIGLTRLTPPSTVTTYVQTAGNLSTIHTTDQILLDSIAINHGGVSKVLQYFDNGGGVTANNNFTTSVTGVGVYNQGSETLASSSTAWELEMAGVITDRNILHYLFYDASNNLPSGFDFDIRWARGLTNNDYLVVSERNGNTNFAITPIGSDGLPIAGARTLRFGFTTGTTSSNGNNRYDWNIRYASSGRYQTQPQYMSAVSVALFNTTSTIYGLRIDNNGDADVKFYGVSDSSMADNPINPLVPGISGNIFGDANGLSDNTVNGQLIDSVGSMGLFVSLIQGGVVLATVPVSEVGSYEFLNITSNTYSTVLHTTSTGSTTSSLPSNWVSTGENNGAGAGSDGTVNGISPSIVVTDSLETQINFGIEQLPYSDSISYTLITSPLLNELRDLVVGAEMGNLSGSDSEDGAYGSGDNFIVTDIADMNGNILFYDANGDGVLDVGEELYSNDTITNYDSSRLSIKFAVNTSTMFTFSYSWIDAAGMSDATPATYTASWSVPVPVELVYFTAEQWNERDVKLNWATASELNNRGFEIYKSSNNGDSFEKIEFVEGQGTSNSLNRYQWIDKNANTKNANYLCYRLNQIDIDGSNELMDKECVDVSQLEATVIYPNPASDRIYINFNFARISEYAIVEIRSIEGTLIESETVLSDDHYSLDIASLRNGVYIIKITNGTKTTSSKLFVNH